MSKGQREKKREGRGKTEPATRSEVKPPPGYLPTADPPRRNLPVLIVSAVLLALWMAVLAYLALSS